MSSSQQVTAKIYAFPAWPKAKTQAARLARLEAEARSYPTIEYGSGWYHDQAIAEANRKGRH